MPLYGVPPLSVVILMINNYADEGICIKNVDLFVLILVLLMSDEEEDVSQL